MFTTKDVVARGRSVLTAMAAKPVRSIEELRAAIVLHDALRALEDLHGLVDEAAEVVDALEPSGPAGERWRDNWRVRAGALGVEVLGARGAVR